MTNFLQNDIFNPNYTHNIPHKKTSRLALSDIIKFIIKQVLTSQNCSQFLFENNIFMQKLTFYAYMFKEDKYM